MASEQADYANEYAMRLAVQQAYLDVAKASIDRSQARAQFVQVAAGAIATACGVGLGLLPKQDGGGTGQTGPQTTLPAQLVIAGQAPLPVQVTVPTQLPGAPTGGQPAGGQNPASSAIPAEAFIPTFFLALAIFGATVYLAYLTRRGRIPRRSHVGAGLPDQQFARLEDFLDWVSWPVNQRLWALHGAVVSLAVGVSLLPLPFLRLDPPVGVLLAALGLVAVFVVPWRLHKFDPK